MRGPRGYYREYEYECDIMLSQVSHNFDNFEVFHSFPHGWDALFDSPDRANCTVYLGHSLAPGVLINHCAISHASIQQGTTPTGMRTFALPLSLGGPLFWRKYEISENHLMVFPEDRELQAMSGGSCDIPTLSLDQQLVDDYLSQSGMDATGLFSTERAVEVAPAEKASMRRSLELFAEFLVKYSNHPEFHAFSAGIREDMVHLLLGSMLNPESLARPVRPSQAARTVRIALGYIESHLSEPLTVAEVCTFVGCSRRVLELSFKRYLGVSPKQLIKLLRLRACRGSLLSAKPSDTVSSIALQHGFWHLGQFAVDYKKAFGESPSTTLKNFR